MVAVFDRRCLETGIGTCLIQSYRVKACEHSDIRKDRRIVLTVAVTIRADILYQYNMKMWTAMTDSLCILSHLAVKYFISTAIRIVNSIKTAGSDTAAAALAFIIINNCFFIYISNSITSALFRAAFASTTDFFVDGRFTAGMLLHLSCTASTTHTNIFKGTAKACCFMSLKMTQADKNICIHDCMSDQGCLAVFTIDNRNFYFICSA